MREELSHYDNPNQIITDQYHTDGNKRRKFLNLCPKDGML